MTPIDTKIAPSIAPGRRVHLAGIGGVSMSPLAEVLHGMGLQVQGSDQSDSAAVERLRQLGIAVHVGHQASDIDGAEFVVRTAATSFFKFSKQGSPLVIFRQKQA